jgi:F420-non-reducing hydrogenase iron-sulfur subunit
MKDTNPRIVCYSCNFAFCGKQASLPANVQLARIQCLGRIDPVSVLEIFEKGADGVILAGCKPPDCHFQDGNIQAEFTVNILKRLLKLTGLESDRLSLTWGSPFEDQNLYPHITEFADSVSKLGYSPLKSAEAESKYVVNIIAAKNAASQFRTRVLLGKEKELTEGINTYGEKIPPENYDAMLDEIVEEEFIRHKIHFLTQNVPLSVKALAEATGLDKAEVLNHVVDMRRKNMLSVEGIQGATPLYRALEV